jgi:nitrite reductase/ring-hydroxylating ferredoxin subunit
LNNPSSENDEARDQLERLAGDIARLEAVAQGWDAHHADTLAAIKSSIEALNAEAFRRLIRYLREDPAASARLNSAVRDPLVCGVLRFHGLIEDPLEHRQVSPPPPAQSATQKIHFVSPSAKPKEEAKQKAEFWQWLCPVEHIPDGGVLTITHWGHHFLLYRKGEDVSCMINACTHRGMPLDSGKIADGVITCPYHDWEFVLKTGECLTEPHDALTMYPIRVQDGHVAVRLPR